MAPYWDDVTLVSSGSVQYSLISRSAGQNVQLLDRVEEFLSQEIGNRIRASWMLVAKWINVCYSGQSQCDQVSKSKIAGYHFSIFLAEKFISSIDCERWKTVLCCVHIQMLQLELGPQ